MMFADWRFEIERELNNKFVLKHVLKKKWNWISLAGLYFCLPYSDTDFLLLQSLKFKQLASLVAKLQELFPHYQTRVTYHWSMIINDINFDLRIANHCLWMIFIISFLFIVHTIVRKNIRALSHQLSFFYMKDYRSSLFLHLLAHVIRAFDFKSG